MLEKKPLVALTEEDGHPVLKTNLYDLIASYRAGMVNSDILGCAFEPEQRFESPDGSDIVFDRDYLGNTRGVGVLPGPFAAPEAAESPLW